MDQLVPHNPFYNVPAAFRLRGGLRPEALARALEEVVARHEVLRSRIETSDGRPRQVVGEVPGGLLAVDDFRSLPAEEGEARARAVVEADAARPFDLAAGPLLRARLVRLDDDQWVLALTLHHVVADGWSMGVLMRELGAGYTAACAGVPSPLAPLPVQYADYAAWQRAWLQGEVLETQLGYWRARLAGLQPLELPTDRPRPPLQSFAGAAWSFTIPAPLTQALRDLGRAHGATLYMTLLAALAALLHRYSGQADIAIGSPIAGRTRPQTEDLIGFFVNILVLRTDCSGDPSFAQLLGRVRETALDAYAHQDLPFEQLVEELHPQRDLSRHPLIQVKLQLIDTSAWRPDLPGVSVEPMPLHNVMTRLDLELDIIETRDTLSARLVGRADLFDEGGVARLAGHLETLLRVVAADPDRRLSAVPLVEGAERDQLLVAWNDTDVARPETTVVERFEAQVAATPDATAVVCGPSRLSYRDLNEEANRLAHHLGALGVGPEVVVGLCLERGVELIVALVGILKAGGAYLPLDPDYPAHRLASMVDDAAVAVLVTDTHLAAALPP
ncbi:MAG: condensation domain-containing protein, partial [Acidimicrobiales bacterium]